MNRIPRLAAIAAAAALVATAFGAASIAQADQISPTPTITLYGQGSATAIGSPITSGKLTDSVMFYGITVSQGCPSGYQQRSDTAIFQNGTRLGNMSQARTQSTTLYGATGLDGNPVKMSDSDNSGATNLYVANKGLSGLTSGTLQPGAFDLRYYCEASSSNTDYVGDKWFDLALTNDGTNWSVPVAQTATTTSLSGSANYPANTVTLTATVKNSGGTATVTGATGTVSFYQSGSSTAIGSGTVSNGVATFTTAAEPTGTTYSFTASYVPDSASTYSGSTSGTSQVFVQGANSGQDTIQVTIPSGVGALTLTGTGQTVNLGTAALNSAGTLLTASGTLPALTVTDTKQVGSASWTLTGQDSDFSTGGSSPSTFDGGYLGWTPSVGAAPEQGTAGPQVTPITSTSDTTDGLKTAPRVLASGSVTANQATTTTSVSALLSLAVPATTTPGAYSSTLTITLS